MKGENSRRTFMLAGLASLSAYFADRTASAAQPVPRSTFQVNLASYGGVPGAAPSAIINAFDSAYAALKANGGGTLLIPPGIYDLGRHDSDAAAVNATGLNNVTISGYGASLRITTTVKAVPAILQFSNCNNITVAGLHFTDPGTDLEVEWKGAACVQVACTKPCSGYKLIDCHGSHVVSLFHATGGGKFNNYLLTNLDIHGSVTDAYYGVNVNYTGRYSKVNLTTNRVRRAYICYGAKDWDVVLDGTLGGPGSNAYCELPTDEYGPVISDLKIRIKARGELNRHSALVTFFHQGPRFIDSTMKNIKVDVDVVDASSLPDRAIFWFTHLTKGSDMLVTTDRTWKNIELTGNMDSESAALFDKANKIVYSTTTSTVPGNSVCISSALVNGRQDMKALPRYFRVVASENDRSSQASRK